MKVFKSVAELGAWRGSEIFAGKTVGFVPTMGALHAGHVALLERARRENDVVILSIFVNPTQFNDPADLEKYPRTWDADLAKAGAAGADAVFAPARDQMYPDGYRFRVSEDTLSLLMEGAERPGHFDGVLTVVLKLLIVVGATRAYFGEKDMQQLMLVRDLVKAFFLPTEIVGCETVRTPEGLALSSRNILLSPGGRIHAAEFSRILCNGGDIDTAKRELETAGFVVDYVEEIGERRFGAVRLEGVRLIDNVRRKHPV